MKAIFILAVISLLYSMDVVYHLVIDRRFVSFGTWVKYMEGML
jgi:hypothetical protein